MTRKNGCFDHPPWSEYYLPTGAPDTPEYRIKHVWEHKCKYQHSNLGQADPQCHGCKHRDSHESKHGLHPQVAA